MKLTPSYDMVVGIGRTGVYFSSLFMSLSKFIQSIFDFFCVNCKSNLSFSILYSSLQLEQTRQSSMVSYAYNSFLQFLQIFFSNKFPIVSLHLFKSLLLYLAILL